MALQSPTADSTTRPPALAPFSVRSFRFQWPADLAMSWAYEMENIVLGWYILVETQSVTLLTLLLGYAIAYVYVEAPRAARVWTWP